MRKFTFEEIMKYKNNRYVKKITYTSIIFTDEFKNILLNKTNSTTDVKIILTSIGIEPHILGKNRIRTLVRNYSKQKCESGSMGKVFSEDEKAFLRKNENIVKITNSKIVYSFEFMIKIAKCKSLGSARYIFINNGLRPETIGEKRINNSFYRWRNIYIKNGEEGELNP